MKKRMLALLLTLCMVVSLLPAQPAVAEGTAQELQLGNNTVDTQQPTIAATFTPASSGTYVFYANNVSYGWELSIDGVEVQENHTYAAHGFRAELTGGTTYNVTITSPFEETLVVAEATASDIVFYDDTKSEMLLGAMECVSVIPLDPSGVLGTIEWSISPEVEDTCLLPDGSNLNISFLTAGEYVVTATDVTNNRTVTHTIQAVEPVQSDVTWEIQGLPEMVAVGDTVTATVVASDGNPITEEVSWSVDNPNVMITLREGDQPSVDVSFLDSGYVTITATNGIVEATKGVSVNPEPARTVAVGETVTISVSDTFQFTPDETGIYTFYRSTQSAGTPSVSWTVSETDASGNRLDTERWFNATPEEGEAVGYRWSMEAGKTYRLYCVVTGNATETFTFQQAVAPTSLSIREDCTIAYVDGMQFPVGVTYAPVYAYLSEDDVTYTIDDTSLANLQEMFVSAVAPGVTTLRAAYGDLTTEATLEIREDAQLSLGQANTVSSLGSYVYYSFTAPSDGDYNFKVTAPAALTVVLTSPGETEDDSFQADWGTAANEELENTVTLQGGRTYRLAVFPSGAADITALVTDAPVQYPIPSISFVDQSGSFTVTDTDGDVTTTQYTYPVPAGETMGDYVQSISDPVHADSTFYFSDWLPCTWNAETGDFDHIPGTNPMTTAEALQYPAQDGTAIVFLAMWGMDESGEEDGSEEGGEGSVELDPINVGDTKTLTFVHDGGLTTDIRYSFTCTEDGFYTAYHSYESSHPAIQVEAYASGSATVLNRENWYAWHGGNSYTDGVRWEMKAGNTYELSFTYFGDATVDYTFQKVVAPTAIAFPQDTYSNFVGSGDSMEVQFTPVYANGEVSYSVDDPTVAQLNEFGSLDYLKAGETMVRATCGNNSASARVISRAPVVLELGKSNVTDTAEGVRVRYTFTPAESGEYNIHLSADKTVWGAIWDGTGESHNFWTVEAGEENPFTITLEANQEYTVDASVDFPNTEITALVSSTMNAPKHLVALDGYKGDDFGGIFKLTFTNGTTYENRLYVASDCVEGAELADVLDVAVFADPTWGNFTFEGWLEYKETGDPFNGPSVLTLLNENPITTAVLLEKTVPDYDVRYIAKWAEIPMSYYESIYDPYFGVGDAEGEITIEINGNDGEFNVETYNDDFTTNGFGYPVPQGGTLADCFISISELLFWNPDRAFTGWKACTMEEMTDDWGDTYWDYVQIPGTDIMTTQEILNYPARDDGKLVMFIAQWEGKDEDYYRNVTFDALDGAFSFGNAYWDNNQSSFSDRFRLNGKTFKETLPSWILSDPVLDGDTFEGWLEYDGETQELISEAILSTAQIGQRTVTDYNVMFVAKWSSIPIADYRNMFTDSEEDGSSSEIPEGVVVTDMKENTKYDVPAGENAYFTFTAPADGWYCLKTDALQGAETELFVNINGLTTQHIHEDNNAAMQLTAGQTVEILAQAPAACKLWVEKANPVTKMEVISQDKTKTYLNSQYLDTAVTLEDVQLKLTYADGTTAEVSGTDFWNFGKGTNGMPLYIYDEKGESTATVTLGCGTVEVQYQIALEKATVVDMEVIPAADMFDHYENAMGAITEGPNGSFFCYQFPHFEYLMATYKFTWSDGRVEEFHIDPDGQPYYYGVYLWSDDKQTEAPWTVGTHKIYFCFGDLEDSITVELKANPVKSIEVLSLGAQQYTLGDPDYFVKVTGGWGMNAIDIDQFEVKVTYTDGTTRILTEKDRSIYHDMVLMLDGKVADIYVDTTQVYTGPGTNKVTVELLGVKDVYEVEVVKQAVANGNTTVSESTVEEALKEVQNGTVTLNVTASKEQTATGAVVSSVKLPTASVEKLVAKDVKQVVIQLDSATVTMDAKTLAAIAEQAKGATITLSVAAVKKETLGEKQQTALKEKNVEMVLTALVLSDGKPIGDFKGGSVKVRVAFTPESGYTYKVVYVADDGQMTQMNTELGKDYLDFWTNHFSDYVVLKEKEEAPAEPTVPEETEPAVPKETEPAVPEETEPAVPEETKPATPEETEPTVPDNPAIPNTGDSSNILGVTAVMLASGMLLAATLWLTLRKRRAA